MTRLLKRAAVLSLVLGGALAAGCGADDTGTTGGGAEEIAPLATVDVPAEVRETALFVNECVLDGEGTEVGSKVGNITLQNCLGEPVALHDYCGRRKAMWFINSAGWCGACEGYVPQASLLAQQRRHEGVELYVLVGEDASGANATQEYCMQYALSHNLDPAHTLYDEENGFYGMWSVIGTGGGGTVGLPFEAVLDPYDMAYMWNNAQGGSVESVLDQLVAE